jgi:hypothetical protein
MAKIVKSFRVEESTWSDFEAKCATLGRKPADVIIEFVSGGSATASPPPAKPPVAPGRTVTVAQPTPAGSTRAMAQPRANPPRTVDAATLASMPMWQRKIFGHVD